MGIKHGVKYINDSKATNVVATENALKTYDNIYWIVGGRTKQDNILNLEKYFPKITQAFLIGESSIEFANLLKNKIKTNNKTSKTLPALVSASKIISCIFSLQVCIITNIKINTLFFSLWQSFSCVLVIWRAV